MQFNVLLISKRQLISSTGDYPLLLKGVPELHLCAHLMGTDRDPSSHTHMCKLQSVMEDSAAGSTMHLEKLIHIPLPSFKNKKIAEDFGLCHSRD